MKTLYFDCSSGISGNMTLGALTEIIGNEEHRNLEDVNKIIDNSNIDSKTKDLAKRIFLRVAKAESKVHNKPIY